MFDSSGNFQVVQLPEANRSRLSTGIKFEYYSPAAGAKGGTLLRASTTPKISYNGSNNNHLEVSPPSKPS